MIKRFYYDEFCEEIFDEEIQTYPSNQSICGILNKQAEKIEELKQQLHDLPKKIVEEIRKEIEFPLYVHPDFDEFECLFDIDKLLDAILKKYGEKNESNND